jgi:hypothetical protein
MNIRTVRIAAAVFFAGYLLAVTWPVGQWFAGPLPFVLGLPFSFFWPVLWIVLGGVVLLLLDRAETTAARGDRP